MSLSTTSIHFLNISTNDDSIISNTSPLLEKVFLFTYIAIVLSSYKICNVNRSTDQRSDITVPYMLSIGTTSYSPSSEQDSKNSLCSRRAKFGRSNRSGSKSLKLLSSSTPKDSMDLTWHRVLSVISWLDYFYSHMLTTLPCGDVYT